jgi:bifunctional non-homologous end joining protein LigD
VSTVRAQQVEVDVEGRPVRLSNVDKLMFPSGFTKGQVIDFYIRVSQWLLPHLRGRAVTLKRYPNGIGAPHFYEKDAPRFTPAWVSTFAVPRRSGESDIHYVLLNDLPSLVWSANLANLEMHPFLSCVPDVQRPTSVVFDLDPGEGMDVLNCGAVAFLLKKRLEKAGLDSWVKVSGSKGMQLYAPLNTKVTYDKTQPFAHSLADEMARDHPGLIVSEMAKSQRRGKVFIDWSQNSDFKTTVCVYSMRAKSDSPFISMPIAWAELTRVLKKGDREALHFNPEAALKRLEKKGDLFEPVLTTKQKLR